MNLHQGSSIQGYVIFCVLLVTCSVYGYYDDDTATDVSPFVTINTQSDYKIRRRQIGSSLRDASSKPILVETEQPFIVYGGYVKTEGYLDSRQTNGNRDSQILYFPQPTNPDVQGKDINSFGQLNILDIQSRVYLKIQGPHIGRKYESSAFVEIDFLGVADQYIDVFKIRHGMMRFNDERVEVIFGQFYSPVFELIVPQTIGFNTGCPFESYSRNPQLRVEYKITDSIKVLAAIVSEVDFHSTGPIGPSVTYFENSKAPIGHLQLQFFHKNVLFNAAIDIRTIAPRIVSNTFYKVRERLVSVFAMAAAAFKFGKSGQFKLKLLYAPNAFAYLMVGGYGIHSVDPVTDKRTYTNIANVSSWCEFMYGDKTQWGIFLGYLKSLGTWKSLAPLASVPGATSYAQLTYGRGTDIDWLGRISPRVSQVFGSLNLCAELEITHGVFGPVQQSGKVLGNDPRTNVRLMLAGYYYF